MVEWLISLAVTVLISLTALVPGTIDQRLSHDLTRLAREKLGKAVAVQAHVEGDPVFQLPWGQVTRLTVHVHGLQTRGIPIEDVRVELAPLHVSPGVLLAHQAPQLLEPAAAHLAVRLARADMQTAVTMMLAGAPPLEANLPLVGRISPRVAHADLKLEGGKIALVGELTLRPGGAPRPFTASLGLSAADGKHLSPTDLHVTVGTFVLPSVLMGGLQHVNLIGLQDLPLPPGDWTMEAPEIDDEGFELRVAGTVKRLPTPEGSAPGVSIP